MAINRISPATRGLISRVSNTARRIIRQENGTLLVLSSGEDWLSAFQDRMDFSASLRFFWYLKGYDLKVKYNATTADLKNAINNPQILNIAVSGHGTWDSWMATDRPVTEGDLAAMPGPNFTGKKLFITYTCGGSAGPRTDDDPGRRAEKKFGFHAVEDPWTQLRGTGGKASLYLWHDKPYLFSLKDLLDWDSELLKFLHSEEYMALNIMFTLQVPVMGFLLFMSGVECYFSGRSDEALAEFWSNSARSGTLLLMITAGTLLVYKYVKKIISLIDNE